MRAAACASGELGASGCVALIGDVWRVSVWRTLLLNYVAADGLVELPGEPLVAWTCVQVLS